jgi:hypothetical protein
VIGAVRSTRFLDYNVDRKRARAVTSKFNLVYNVDSKRAGAVTSTKIVGVITSTESERGP